MIYSFSLVFCVFFCHSIIAYMITKASI